MCVTKLEIIKKSSGVLPKVKIENVCDTFQKRTYKVI